MTQLPPYQCIRCNYKTKIKSHMKDHLYKKIKSCPPVKNDIELTNEIKEEILLNRFYKICSKPITKTISNDIVDDLNEYHYIYMLRPKENVLHKENVYKIGKTKIKNFNNNFPRLSTYGKGTEVIYLLQCSDCDLLERKIIEEFNKLYSKYQFGNEYFVGDKFNMISTILKISQDFY